jgi:hypothetical protein
LYWTEETTVTRGATVATHVVRFNGAITQEGIVYISKIPHQIEVLVTIGYSKGNLLPLKDWS